VAAVKAVGVDQFLWEEPDETSLTTQRGTAADFPSRSVPELERIVTSASAAAGRLQTLLCGSPAGGQKPVSLKRCRPGHLL